jgi:hypothetical protein
VAWSGSKWKAVVLDFGERAGWSAAQVFYATVTAGGVGHAVIGLPWKHALILGVSAGVSSIILTLLQYLSRATDLSFWPDAIVRLAKTFVGSLAGSLAAAKVFDAFAFNWTNALNIAFLATLAALGKALLARGPHVSPEVSVDPQAVAVGRAKVPTQRANPSTLASGTYYEAVSRK